MQLINETGQALYYSISSPGSGDCGQLAVDGMADWPGYDNQSNVQVSFSPVSGSWIDVTIAQTTTGQQVEIALLAE